MSRFEEFWEAYPKKVGKKSCQQKWNQKKLDERADMVIADVQWRAKFSKKWQKGFVPNPHTFLHGERWEDERDDFRDEHKPAPSSSSASFSTTTPFTGDHWDRVANFAFLEVVNKAGGLPVDVIREMIRVKNEWLRTIREDPDGFDGEIVAGGLKAKWRKVYADFRARYDSGGVAASGETA